MSFPYIYWCEVITEIFSQFKSQLCQNKLHTFHIVFCAKFSQFLNLNISGISAICPIQPQFGRYQSVY